MGAKPNQGTVWPLQVPTLGRRWESKTERGTGNVREGKRPDEGSKEMEWLPSKGGFSVHLQDPTVCLRDSELVLRDRNVSGTENKKLVVGPQRKGHEARHKLQEGGPGHVAATWPQRGGLRAIGKPNSRAGRCDSGLGHRCPLMAEQLWSRVRKSCRNSRWGPPRELWSGGSPPAWTSSVTVLPLSAPKGWESSSPETSDPLSEPPASDR